MNISSIPCWIAFIIYKAVIKMPVIHEYSELISFRIDWFDLLAVQETLNSLLQHCSSKPSVLWCSAFFLVELSHPYMITGTVADFIFLGSKITVDSDCSQEIKRRLLLGIKAMANLAY